jgi:hypothetical protein
VEICAPFSVGGSVGVVSGFPPNALGEEGVVVVSGFSLVQVGVQHCSRFNLASRHQVSVAVERDRDRRVPR